MLANFFSCYLWWFLAGALLGWLLNWCLCKCCGRNNSNSNTHLHAETTAAAKLAAVSAAPTIVTDPIIDKAAAKASGFVVRGADDLEIIEGIGPKICKLFHTAGFHTFMQVSTMSVTQMSKILDDAGPNFRLANPGTWAQQANLAANNRWGELKKLQDELSAGVDLVSDDKA